MPPGSTENTSKPAAFDRFDAWALFLIFVVFIAMAGLASTRQLFLYGTETDFIGAMIPEAQRILAGEPLSIEFHPPFYSAVLAVAYSVVGSWIHAGVGVSLLSALLITVFSYLFFARTWGRGAGIGAAAFLLASPMFVNYSAQATSDVFSMLLHVVAVYLCWLAAAKNRWWLHLAAGLTIGLAFLTRTNNIALLALLAFYLIPIVQRGRAGLRFSALGPMVLALTMLVATISTWVVIAKFTGAPVAPGRNYKNLAMTYYSTGEDRLTGDALNDLGDRFHSTWDVFTYDPAHMASVYVRDLIATARHLGMGGELMPFGLCLLGAIALLSVIVFARNLRWYAAVLALSLLGMMLLINFKAFEARYYIFLLPFLGASLGWLVSKVVPMTGKVGWRATVGTVAAAVFLLAFGRVARQAPYEFESQSSADAAAACEALQKLETGHIVSRKPHLPFYAGQKQIWIPDVDTIAALRSELAVMQTDNQPVYLFFGSSESQLRASLNDLRRPEAVADQGFNLLASGSESGGWWLYRFTGE